MKRKDEEDRDSPVSSPDYSSEEDESRRRGRHKEKRRHRGKSRHSSGSEDGGESGGERKKGKKKKRSTKRRHYSDSGGSSSEDEEKRVGDGDGEEKKKKRKKRRHRSHRSEDEKEKPRKRSKRRDYSSGSSSDDESSESETERKKKKKLLKEAKRILKAQKASGKSDDKRAKNVDTLTMDDYFSKNPEFSTWLKETRGLYFSTLSSDESRKIFSTFADEWNAGKLPHRYYQGIQAAKRTNHKWNIEDAAQVDEEDERLQRRKKVKAEQKKFSTAMDQMRGRRRAILNPVQRKLLEGQSVKRHIRDQEFGLFHTVGCSQWLAFPGFRTTSIGARPPREFWFTARAAYLQVIAEVLYGDGLCDHREGLYGDKRGVMITGPKGAGKSCILRAVAVELIGRVPAVKVVCFWYFDALADLRGQVQEALLFTYCEASSEVIAEIQQIATVEHLSRFLDNRKASGDLIVMVSDGEERYDIQRKEGLPRTRRAEAKKWLETFERLSVYIIKALSPAANEARKVPENMTAYELTANLSEGEYLSFLQDNLLDRILIRHPIRQGDVDFHAGKHPMSLYLLNKACEDYVQPFTRRNTKRRRFGVGIVNSEGDEIPDDPQTEEPGSECYLDDDEDWEQVLAIFRQGEPFKSIRRYIKEEYHGDEESLRTPASVLKSYVEEGLFCTNYLYAVHMQAAMERLNRSVFRSPVFQAYLSDKLKKPEIVWAEVGWACEGFVADAVMALGLMFEGRKVQPSEVRFLQGEPVRLNPTQWEPEKPIYFVPGKCSFKYVDGLLVWVDKEGVVHILALQVTVSPETHRSTEYKFMQRAEMERWYSGKCVIHYLYLCPAGVTGGGKKQGKVARELDMVEYSSKDLKLSECFGANLGQDELILLGKLGQVREKEVERRKEAKRLQAQAYSELLRRLPPEKLELYKQAKKRPKPRQWLEAMARQRGMVDPSKKYHKNIYSLLEAMS